MRDGAVDVVDDVDGYHQEGQMTTFFRHGAGRNVVDAWSTRIASFRTSEILAIRLVTDAATESHRRLTAIP